MSLPRPLVSTVWLAEHLHAVKIIDASWRMPGGSAGRDDYDNRHIQGAVFFDIDLIADKSTDLPHMLPAPDAFANAVGVMGICDTDTVIIYDDQGVFSAPRVWWTFRAMGHERVAVLDGGLKKWLAEDRNVTGASPAIQPVKYVANIRPELIRGTADIRTAINTGASQIIDARSADRFLGRAPEPRAGLLSGAMPNSKNTPFDTLLKDDGTMKSHKALRALFAGAGVDLSAPAVTTCGSGVTAAVIALALESLGHRQWSLYDGSWAEWGKKEYDRSAYPIVVDGQ